MEPKQEQQQEPQPAQKAEPEKRNLVKEVHEEAKKHFPDLTDAEIESFL